MMHLVLQLRHYWLLRHLLMRLWQLKNVMMLDSASFLLVTVAGVMLRARLSGALLKGDIIIILIVKNS